MHRKTDGVVGQQDAVDFLQDTTRRAASKMDMSVELMRFQLVVSDFDFSPLEEEHDQFLGGMLIRVQQSRDPAMTFTVTGSIRFVQGVLDDAHDQAVGLMARISSNFN